MKRNNYVDDIKSLPIADITTRQDWEQLTGELSKNGKCFSVNVDPTHNYFHFFIKSLDNSSEIGYI